MRRLQIIELLAAKMVWNDPRNYTPPLGRKKLTRLTFYDKIWLK